jgi:hypothetical protein
MMKRRIENIWRDFYVIRAWFTATRERGPVAGQAVCPGNSI